MKTTLTRLSRHALLFMSVFAMLVQTANAGLNYVINDTTGAPYALINPAQNKVVWKTKTRSYGEGLVNEDPDNDGHRVSMPIRYPGQYFDAESGLHYNYKRYYDPNLGRYISPDPMGLAGGLNLYAYANADPVNFVDPTGEIPLFVAVPVVYFGLFMLEQFLFDPSDYENGEIAPASFPIAPGPGSVNAVKNLGKIIGKSCKGGPVAKSADNIADYAHNYQRSVGASQRVPKVLQSGGNKLSKRVSDGLNDYFDQNLTKRDWGRALEALKKEHRLRNDHHSKILDNGDYINDAGDLIGNIADHLP